MRYLFAPEHHPESRFYRDLESKAVLLKTFDLPATGWTNPKIQIYALRNSKGAVPGVVHGFPGRRPVPKTLLTSCSWTDRFTRHRAWGGTQARIARSKGCSCPVVRSSPYWSSCGTANARTPSESSPGWPATGLSSDRAKFGTFS